MAVKSFLALVPVGGHFAGGDGVDGEDEPVVVVAHVQTGQHAGQTQGRELLLGHGPAASGFGLQDVGAHNISLEPIL
jgi:hypothetical protein